MTRAGRLGLAALATAGARAGIAQQPAQSAAPQRVAAQAAAPATPEPTTAAAALARAFDFEGASRAREAAASYRRALALADRGDADTRDAALLGLERAWSDAGQPDSTLAAVGEALRERPSDVVAHAIALRTLATLGRDAAARAAYERWRAAAPADPAPYTAYAQLLLDAGDRRAADSVLADADRAPLAREARRQLGPTRARALAAGGAWAAAAGAWAAVLAADPVYTNAVVFALRPTPEPERDAVVGALVPGGQSPAPARYAAAGLLATWHRATAAWALAATLPRDTSSLELWRAVAGELDAAGARREGAAAWQRVLDVSAPANGPAGADAREAIERAAEDALLAGDPARALAVADRGPRSTSPSAAPSDTIAPRLALVRVRALAALGRLDEAERAAAALPRQSGAAAADALANAWVARGDLARARAVLGRAGADAPEIGGANAAEPPPDAGEAAGWVALAGGDLRRARAIFAHAPPAAAPAPGLLADVRAAARTALARTRADTAADLGAALVGAARGDAPAASRALERAARALPDAAPPLLAAAADAAAGAGDRARAAALWQRLLAESADAPEAPAAELAWARALLAAGDRGAARARFEHLVVAYPESALVPLARRELERLGA